MDERLRPIEKEHPRPWSIIGGSYDPKKIKSSVKRLQGAESSIRIIYSPEAAVRSWSAQLVILALEISNPELFNDDKLAPKIYKEIGYYSRKFQEASASRLETASEGLGFSEDFPVMRTLKDILELNEARGLNRNEHYSEMAAQVPELSKKLLKYIYVRQGGISDEILDVVES